MIAVHLSLPGDGVRRCDPVEEVRQVPAVLRHAKSDAWGADRPDEDHQVRPFRDGPSGVRDRKADRGAEAPDKAVDQGAAPPGASERRGGAWQAREHPGRGSADVRGARRCRVAGEPSDAERVGRQSADLLRREGAEAREPWGAADQDRRRAAEAQSVHRDAHPAERSGAQSAFPELVKAASKPAAASLRAARAARADAGRKESVRDAERQRGSGVPGELRAAAAIPQRGAGPPESQPERQERLGADPSEDGSVRHVRAWAGAAESRGVYPPRPQVFQRQAQLVQAFRVLPGERELPAPSLPAAESLPDAPAAALLPNAPAAARADVPQSA